MAKDLYQNTNKDEKPDSNKTKRQYKKRTNRIIGIAALVLLFAACGAPSEKAEEMQSAETKEEPEEWQEEHDRCPHSCT